jgi:hypothetical protein
MNRVPDLHYIVVRSHTVFCRRGHLTVFYRHDRDGRKFIYHVANHYGEDGRDTRARARRYGRDIVTRKQNMPLRNLAINVDDRATVRAAGLDPEYAQVDEHESRPRQRGRLFIARRRSPPPAAACS